MLDLLKIHRPVSFPLSFRVKKANEELFMVLWINFFMMSWINLFKKEDCRGIDNIVEDRCSSCYLLYSYLGISGRDSFKGDRSVTFLF
jgi:hypothetical protein